MYVSTVIPSSLNNGDGIRLVIVFQGCSLKCSGCFSKDLQPFDTGQLITPKQLAKAISKEVSNNNMLDGITLSGGNPPEQEDLLEFLVIMKKLKPRLNIWCWTGFEFDELPDERILDYIDVLVTGRYIKTLHFEHEYYGSSNQDVWRKENGKWTKDAKRDSE